MSVGTLPLSKHVSLVCHACVRGIYFALRNSSIVFACIALRMSGYNVQCWLLYSEDINADVISDNTLVMCTSLLRLAEPENAGCVSMFVQRMVMETEMIFVKIIAVPLE